MRAGSNWSAIEAADEFDGLSVTADWFRSPKDRKLVMPAKTASPKTRNVPVSERPKLSLRYGADG